MIIKRDILGTIVNIELTEQEVMLAHRCYLEHELAKTEGTVQTYSVADDKFTVSEFLPSEQDSAERLLEKCRSELLRVSENQYGKGKILKKYEGALQKLYDDGMGLNELAAVLGVTHATLGYHITTRHQQRLQRQRKFSFAS